VVVVGVAGVRQRERAHKRKTLQRSAVANNALALRAAAKQRVCYYLHLLFQSLGKGRKGSA
jgi:hypothetical protein